MYHCYVTCYIPTLLLPAGQAQAKTALWPRAVGAVRLQGSGYYICSCICYCATCPVTQPAPRAGRPQACCWLSRVTNRLAAARVQQWWKSCRHTADFHLHLRLRGLLAAAALRRWRSACSDTNLVGRHLHKQGKCSRKKKRLEQFQAAFLQKITKNGNKHMLRELILGETVPVQGSETA